MIRFFYCYFSALIIFTFSASLHAATLTVADSLIVNTINDQKIDHGLVGKKSTFNLNAGSQALILHYKDVYEDLDFAEDRVVKSKDFVVKFTLSKEKNIRLKTTKITNLKQAEDFAKTPTLSLIDEQGKQITLELIEVSDYKLAKQVNVAVSALAVTPRIDKNTKPAVDTFAAKSSVSVSQPTIDNNNLTQVDPTTMLKYWWSKASNAQKQSFETYLKSQ